MDKFLFDTTYILPYFGIDIKITNIIEDLTRIQNNNADQIKISTCSLIEAKWKAIRLYNQENNLEYLKRANNVILSFGMNKYFEVIDPWFHPEISFKADELLIAGHKDYMDCLIFATAKIYKNIIVTEDKQILKVIRSLENWSELKVINWKEFTTNISN